MPEVIKKFFIIQTCVLWTFEITLNYNDKRFPYILRKKTQLTSGFVITAP